MCIRDRYLTLAGGGALSLSKGIELVDTMGTLMEEHGFGGQLVYPFVDENWTANPANEESIRRALADANQIGKAYLSIRLGGTAVLAGDERGLAALEASLPETQERYPFRLARHAAFHTPLLSHVSDLASDQFANDFFQKPTIPMIDGRGTIWLPQATNREELREYTLGHQVTETYNFSKSIEVAVKEFAPDKLILTGPGSTLGAPIAQELIKHNWRGLTSKADFSAAQKEEAFLLAMGREDQRPLVV